MPVLYVLPALVLADVIGHGFATDVPEGCIWTTNTLSCDHKVPRSLPAGIAEIYITDYTQKSPITIPNNDSSWRQIEKLDIILNPEGHYSTTDLRVVAYDMISDGAFGHLSNLRYLGIHCWILENLPLDVFSNLTNLEEINLSNCGSLIPKDDIVPPIARTALPNLKSLNLDRVAARSGKQMDIGEDFIHMMSEKNITQMSIRDTNILIKGSSWWSIPKPLALETIDLSGITMMLSNLTAQQLVPVLSNIKTINISSIDSRYELFKFGIVENEVWDMCSVLSLPLGILENVYANNLAGNTQLQSVNNVTYYLNTCTVNLRRIHLKSNNIFKMNATTVWPLNNSVVEMDLSDNRMTYLSPNFLNGLLRLKHLFLANNNLRHMESKHEFSQLLEKFTELRHFSVAGNQLNYIPVNMFKYNLDLRILELQRNNLKAITFKLAHLKNIDELDLTSNKFKQLDATSYKQLSDLIAFRTGNKHKFDQVIKLDDNPFQCTCDSVDFQHWMTTEYYPVSGKSNYRCELDDEMVDISIETINRSRRLCHRTTIIVVTAVSAGIITTAFIIATAILIRRHYNKKKLNGMKEFLKALKANTLVRDGVVLRYLAFLSYCSDDEAIAVRVVHEQLDKAFRDVLEDNTETICLGARQFRPGFSVLREIMRCVSESCVTICIVSRAFCLSDWCGLEVQEAVEQKKPIILIFTEMVEEKHMSAFVRRIFQRYTRAKLIQINGQYELEPGWKSLCDSVVLLASESN